MRTRRIKIAAQEAEAVYHCISRTVNGEWLFDAVDKESFRRLLWSVADYCGVEGANPKGSGLYLFNSFRRPKTHRLT